MRIATSTIVFNAESTLPKGMLEAQLEQLYYIGDKVVICEGATRAKNHYFDGDTSVMTRDGKSTDETLDIILNFPDPDNKIVLIEGTGFWDGKTSMCNAILDECQDCDYLWQVDADEFWHKDDVYTIKQEILEKYHPEVVRFFAYHFFGGFEHCITPDSANGGWGNSSVDWYRIFKIGEGFRWASHEPPIMLDEQGIKLNNVFERQETLDMGILMHHYSCVCESQIDFKHFFFQNNDYGKYWDGFKKGEREAFGSKIEDFKYSHPKWIEKLLV